MRNGYGESMFPTEDGECFVCGFKGDTARHEVIHGPNRTLSKKLGLWIAVCPRCHTRIHQDDNGEFLFLKQDAQAFVEDEFNMDRDEFIKLFGRSYL